MPVGINLLHNSTIWMQLLYKKGGGRSHSKFCYQVSSPFLAVVEGWSEVIGIPSSHALLLSFEGGALHAWQRDILGVLH